MKSLLLPTLCSFALASCGATYRIEGSRGALAKHGTAKVVVKENYSGNAATHRAVEQELQKRGFKITNGGKADLTAQMGDTWHWDVVMYLVDLDLVFADPDTGMMRARAFYHNSPAHGYPNSAEVVEQLFTKMDEEGIFSK